MKKKSVKAIFREGADRSTQLKMWKTKVKYWFFFFFLYTIFTIAATNPVTIYAQGYRLASIA